MAGLDAALPGLTALYGVSQAHIARRLGPVGGAAMRLQLTTDAQAFANILDGWDERELARYRSHLPPDMAHPLVYAAALSAGVARLHRLRPMSRAKRRALYLAPIAAAAGDYIENVGHWYLLDHRDQISPALVRTLGTVSRTKWVLALGSLAYLAQGIPRAWLRTRRRGA